MITKFVCQNCGAISQKWMGRCPSCNEYNSMVEEVINGREKKRNLKELKPVFLSDVPFEHLKRKSVGCSELDRVLGGGLVKGSLILLGGDPGIGKSTLMLQIADHIAKTDGGVFYVSGEESPFQVRLRAERVNVKGEKISFLCETELDSILNTAGNVKPELMVIDSIQTVYKSSISSAPGSVSQVRECGGDLMRFAKENGITTVIIGHVTKYGIIAGPKTLEHIVDTVLYFEGEKNGQYRILRATKNRFGSTNEMGVFEMTAVGLKEVANPSSIFISDSSTSGSAVVSVIEGSRPLLVEVQALTSPTFFNYPQRVTTGIDYKRLSMLLAVLERRVGINVYGLDCFVNVVGGIKLFETSSDLGIMLAIASSIKNKPIEKGAVIIGEVGLGGEVRSVYAVDTRLKEVEKLGFKKVFVPAKSSIPKSQKIEIIPVREAKEAVEIALGT